MTVLFGLTAAVCWGTSDFLGGLAGRRLGLGLSSTIAFVTQFVGLVGLGGLGLVIGGELTSTDWAWAAGAGLSSAAGILFLYRGLAIGRMGVVAPITGALAAGVPAVVSPLIGESPEPLAWVGIVVAVAAIVLVAREQDEAAVAPDAAVARFGPPGLLEGVVAGFGFAGVGIFLNGTSDGSGLLPFLPMKALAAAILGLLLVRRGERPREVRGSWPIVLGAGVLDNAANVAYLFAVREGALAIAAVLSSLYPVGTVLLARVVLHERLARVQQVGFALAVAAIVLIGTA